MTLNTCLTSLVKCRFQQKISECMVQNIATQHTVSLYAMLFAFYKINIVIILANLTKH